MASSSSSSKKTIKFPVPFSQIYCITTVLDYQTDYLSSASDVCAQSGGWLQVPDWQTSHVRLFGFCSELDEALVGTCANNCSESPFHWWNRKIHFVTFSCFVTGVKHKCLKSQQTHFCLSSLKKNLSSISHLLRYFVAANCAAEEKFMRKVNPHQTSGGKGVLSSAKQSKPWC